MWAVTGAGGFIGGHMVKRLIAMGEDVVGIDQKSIMDWYQVPSGEACRAGVNLSHVDDAVKALHGAKHVIHLAADMGGMGFIETHKAECMLSVLSSTAVLIGAARNQAHGLFYASSACVYPGYLQDTTGVADGLREADAYPAMPEDGYGYEKLFSERMSRHFMEDFHLPTFVGRYHNVYGPHGTWEGGREKAPAAICRKVIEAKLSGIHDIEIWGDGEQTRSFMYVDDCVEGTLRLMRSDFHDPINIGSDRLVTINELVTIVEKIAGIWLDRHYKLDAPLGVRGRNSNNELIRATLGWEPKVSLEDGMAETYDWIYSQITQ